MYEQCDDVEKMNELLSKYLVCVTDDNDDDDADNPVSIPDVLVSLISRCCGEDHYLLRALTHFLDLFGVVARHAVMHASPFQFPAMPTSRQIFWSSCYCC